MDVKLEIPSREEGEKVGEAAGRTENGLLLLMAGGGG